MRTFVQTTALIAATLLLAACGAPNNPAESNPGDRPQPPVKTAPATDPKAPSPGRDRVIAREALAGLEANASDMDLYMHDIEPTGDARRKPTLWVHAAQGRLKADSSWELADARAIIYREQDEDIRLESKAGRFDESNKIALLDGGVKVAAGGVQFETVTVSYDNAQRVVQTHSPVHLTDGRTSLTADMATLEPDEGSLTLTNVSGTLAFDGEFE